MLRSPSWRRRPAPAVLVAVATLVVSRCGGQGNAEADNVLAAVQRFAAATGSDPAQACGMLAPNTLSELEDSEGPCADSLPKQDLPALHGVGPVTVYGKDAMVHLAQDTLFLARFDDGWRITAAGCTAQGNAPYKCKLKGN